MKIIVDISDARVSQEPSDELVTYSLGSCLGVAVYDRATKMGGMLHFQLPSSADNESRAKERPFMYADTGIAWLIRKFEQRGAVKKRLMVKVAGGAQMMNDANMFNIGKRNYLALRKLLWKYGMFIDGEDVGGKVARNLTLRISDGAVMVKSQGRETAI